MFIWHPGITPMRPAQRSGKKNTLLPIHYILNLYQNIRFSAGQACRDILLRYKEVQSLNSANNGRGNTATADLPPAAMEPTFSLASLPGPGTRTAS